MPTALIDLSENETYYAIQRIYNESTALKKRKSLYFESDFWVVIAKSGYHYLVLKDTNFPVFREYRYELYNLAKDTNLMALLKSCIQGYNQFKHHSGIGNVYLLGNSIARPKHSVHVLGRETTLASILTTFYARENHVWIPAKLGIAHYNYIHGVY